MYTAARVKERRISKRYRSMTATQKRQEYLTKAIEVFRNSWDDLSYESKKATLQWESELKELITQEQEQESLYQAQRLHAKQRAREEAEALKQKQIAAEIREIRIRKLAELRAAEYEERRSSDRELALMKASAIREEKSRMSDRQKQKEYNIRQGQLQAERSFSQSFAFSSSMSMLHLHQILHT